MLGGLLKTSLGTDFAMLRPYHALQTEADGHPIAARLFPADNVPFWQIVTCFGATLIVTSYLYANRQKIKGWSGENRLLVGCYYCLGLTAVVLIFSLIYAVAP